MEIVSVIPLETMTIKQLTVFTTLKHNWLFILTVEEDGKVYSFKHYISKTIVPSINLAFEMECRMACFAVRMANELCGHL